MRWRYARPAETVSATRKRSTYQPMPLLFFCVFCVFSCGTTTGGAAAFGGTAAIGSGRGASADGHTFGGLGAAPSGIGGLDGWSSSGFGGGTGSDGRTSRIGGCDGIRGGGELPIAGAGGESGWNAGIVCIS